MVAKCLMYDVSGVGSVTVLLSIQWSHFRLMENEKNLLESNMWCALWGHFGMFWICVDNENDTQ